MNVIYNMSDNKCVLNADEQKQWAFYENDVHNSHEWLPLCSCIDGIRHHVLYRNNFTSSGAKYKCLIVFISTGEHNINDLTDEQANEKYKWICSMN